MENWIISVLSAIGGAVVALLGRELIEWRKRPKLKIDFEEREGQKPYIPDYNDETIKSAGNTNRVKYLRLLVHNKGKKPALDCEAKLEIVLDELKNMPYNVALHWSRRDPALYSEYLENGTIASTNNEKVFAPISLNINDKETVDVFSFRYSFSTLPDTDHTPRFLPVIESVSLRQLQLQPNTIYQCKVTVYSSNTDPKSFEYRLNWNGTLDGFYRAFVKD
jgi:hypothetical protein